MPCLQRRRGHPPHTVPGRLLDARSWRWFRLRLQGFLDDPESRLRRALGSKRDGTDQQGGPGHDTTE